MTEINKILDAAAEMTDSERRLLLMFVEYLMGENNQLRADNAELIRKLLKPTR